jgi:hypothetical protein
VLVSVEEVRDYTQSEARDLEDETISILIEAATREFANHCEREFEPTDEEEERTFLHTGGLFLDLAPYDVRSVSALTTGAETESPVLAGGYRLRPLPSKDGTYQRVRLAVDPGECEVKVKGLWGFAEVPEDVKHLALATVTIWAKREIQVFERVYNLDSSFLERPHELPTAVEAGLSNYKRLVVP